MIFIRISGEIFEGIFERFSASSPGGIHERFCDVVM